MEVEEMEEVAALHDDAGSSTAERETDWYDGGPLLISALAQPLWPLSFIPAGRGSLQTEAAAVTHRVSGLNTLGELGPRGVVDLRSSLVHRPWWGR